MAVLVMSSCSGVFVPACSITRDCRCDSVRVIVRVAESVEVAGMIALVRSTLFAPLLSVMVIPARLTVETSMYSLNVRVRVPVLVIVPKSKVGAGVVRAGAVTSLVTVSDPSTRPIKAMPATSLIAVLVMSICRPAPVCSAMTDCRCSSVRVMVRTFVSVSVVGVAVVSRVTVLISVPSLMEIPARITVDTSMYSLNVRVSVPVLEVEPKSRVRSVRVGAVVSSITSKLALSRPAKVFPAMSAIAVAITLIRTGELSPACSITMDCL